MYSPAPIVIAIETSTELASVALLHRGKLTLRESSGAQTHSLRVPAMLQDLLLEAEITLAQCDALAFGAGPGSFTGVRTACGLAQGLAFGANIPVVPIVTLLAMAERARAAGVGNDIVAVLDARMGEVYWAQYQFSTDWQEIIAPTLSVASSVVPEGSAIVCGNGLIPYGEQMRHLDLSSALPSIMPHASDVARLAISAINNGMALHARDAQPLYLRNKVALTTLERMSGVAA